MVLTLPGPIAFGGDARLPLVAASFGMKATQAGTITLSTEGTVAVVEAVAVIAPGTDPIPTTATCTAATPETLLTATASDVASATQTALPKPGATPAPSASTGTASSSTVSTGTTSTSAAATAADRRWIATESTGTAGGSGLRR